MDVYLPKIFVLCSTKKKSVSIGIGDNSPRLLLGSLSPVEWLSGATPHLLTSGGDVPNVQQLPGGPASATGREVQNVQDPSPLSSNCFEFRLRGCEWLCFEGSASGVQEHGGGRGPVAAVARWRPGPSGGRPSCPEPRQRVKCHGTMS